MKRKSFVSLFMIFTMVLPAVSDVVIASVDADRARGDMEKAMGVAQKETGGLGEEDGIIVKKLSEEEFKELKGEMLRELTPLNKKAKGWFEEAKSEGEAIRKAERYVGSYPGMKIDAKKKRAQEMTEVARKLLLIATKMLHTLKSKKLPAILQLRLNNILPCEKYAPIDLVRMADYLVNTMVRYEDPSQISDDRWYTSSDTDAADKQYHWDGSVADYAWYLSILNGNRSVRRMERLKMIAFMVYLSESMINFLETYNSELLFY